MENDPLSVVYVLKPLITAIRAIELFFIAFDEYLRIQAPNQALFPKNKGSKLVPPGADDKGHASALYSCHGIFIDRSLFKPNFRGMRLPWECYDQSQENNLKSQRHWTGSSLTKEKVY